MTTAKVRQGLDSWTHSGVPNGNFGGGIYVRIQGGGSPTKNAYIFFKNPAPLNATVLSATLYMYGHSSWGSSVTVNLQRVGGTWREDQITYSNAPSLTGPVVSLTQDETTDALEWAFDVTALMQTITDGSANYGFQLSTSDTNEHRFYSLDASDNRPVLEVEWSDAPDAPSELSPYGGASVTLQNPTLLFNFHDIAGLTAMQACRVQINTSSDMTNPQFDSGNFLTSDPQLDTSASFAISESVTTTSGSPTIGGSAGQYLNADVGATITGTGIPGSTTILSVATDGSSATMSNNASASGTITATITRTWVGISVGSTVYWRVQVQDAAGLWSAWSDVVHFNRVARGTLSIGSPTGGVEYDATPTIIWSLTGATQTSSRIIVVDDSNPTFHLYDTGRISGSATSWTLPKGVITSETTTYRLTVRTWDDPTRVATPNDLIHTDAVTTFTYTDDFGVGEVTGLTAAQVASGQPHVALTWTDATAPDYYSVWRDGVVVDTDLTPADYYVSGTTYQYIDRTAQPSTSHTWKVRRKISGHLGPSPTASLTYTISGIWLVDLDTGKLVQINPTSSDWSSATFAMPEVAGLFRPIDGNHAVRITQGQSGLEGTITGLLMTSSGISADTHTDNLLWMKARPENVLRLSIGNQNLEVTIGNVVIGPTVTVPEEGARQVSFDFYSQEGPVRQ